MDRSLVKFKVVDTIGSLSHAWAIITKCPNSTIDVGYRSLHQVARLPTHKLASRPVGHRRDPSTQGLVVLIQSSRRVPKKLIEVFSLIVLSLVRVVLLKLLLLG